MIYDRLVTRPHQVNVALNMIYGHLKFLDTNTALTVDPRTDLFVLNSDGVLANNRHFISDTRQEYQPNGDATTEGQALQIIGFVYAHLATGDPQYLDKAVWCWDAYVDFFYNGQPIPETPQRWICNWLVNGKEPCLANWPINSTAPTNGGYKGVPLRFVNGQAQVPHGSPFWGEYLDVVTFAHRGHPAWGAMNASIRPLKDVIDWDEVYDLHKVTTMPADPTDRTAWVDWASYLGDSYTPDWTGPYATEYPVDWIIAWTGNKIDWDGSIVSSEHDPSEVGTIQLKDTNLNGVYLMNYAVRLPVEHGGYLFSRNEPWHNRPVHTPLLGSANQMGNAADAEVWFVDACYLLWKVTGHGRYKKALDSVLFTAYEYTLIDSGDRFFRVASPDNTPYTDGIAYDYIHPSNADFETGRNANGHIVINADGGSQYTVEVQSINFRINSSAKLRTSVGGVGASLEPLQITASLRTSSAKRDAPETMWIAPLPASTSTSLVTYDIPITKMIRVADENGDPYLIADPRDVTDYGGCVVSRVYESAILGNRIGNVMQGFFPDDDAGFVIGNWRFEGGSKPLESITYRADGEFFARISDDDGWRWWWPLPDTGGVWTTVTLSKSGASLSGWQPDAPSGAPDPEFPNYTEIDQISVLLDSSTDTNKTFAYYCLNALPPQYDDPDEYTTLYQLVFSSPTDYEALIGECTVLDHRDDSLDYCPGVIPFSNIYVEGSDDTLDSWHGLPYPGYQYPIIFCLGDSGYMSRHMNNNVDFLYDSQQAYYDMIGEMGPVASAYIWDRPDATVYGAPDTWTMYHWGDGHAWSGYQPRAFFAGCRAWQHLVKEQQPVPPKLVTYCERWIQWLIDFMPAHAGLSPTEFYADKPAEAVENDFTGHMAGLWLAGLCAAFDAGCRLPGLEQSIEVVFKEISSNYEVLMAEHPMNGSWSPWTGTTTFDPVTGKPRSTGMFFGFWSGEILRGLSMYVLYKTGRTLP